MNRILILAALTVIFACGNSDNTEESTCHTQEQVVECYGSPDTLLVFPRLPEGSQRVRFVYYNNKYTCIDFVDGLRVGAYQNNLLWCMNLGL